MSQPLVASGAISQVEILRLRRSAVEMRGSLDATNLAIPRAESAVKEIRSKIEESELGFRSDAFKELNDARTELKKITATSSAIQDRVSRTTVVVSVLPVRAAASSTTSALCWSSTNTTAGCASSRIQATW